MRCNRLILWLSKGVLSLTILSAINCSFAKPTIQTLPYIVQITLQQNPTTLSKKANIQAAAAALRQAKGGFLPSLDARFATGPENTESPSTAGSTVRLNRTESSLVLTQPIFSGFSTYNLTKERQAELSSANHLLADNQENLALQAANAYLNIMRLNKLYALTLNNVYTHKQILRKVRIKFTGGASRKTDVDLAIGRLAQRQTTLSTIQGSQQIAKANFITIVGLAPKQLQTPALPKVPTTLLQAQTIALQYNPMLRAAKSNLKAAAAIVAVKKSKLFPTVNVEVSGNNNNNLDGTPGRAKDIRGMVVINYNIFNGTSDQAAISQAKQQRFAVLYNLNQLKRDILRNVTQAWTNLITDKKRLQEIRIHYLASQEVLTGYKKQFTLGRRSLLNVLDMENEAFNTKVALINAKYTIKNDSYALLANMGILARNFRNKPIFSPM